MKPVLVVQNTPIESPGIIPDYLDEKSISFELFRSFEGENFPSPENFDAVISLGCPHSVIHYYRHDYLKKLYHYAAAAVRREIPYLGICFGGQLLAKVLGARVEPNKVKEIGTYDVGLTPDGERDPLFKGFESSFKVFHWHGDTFRVPFGEKLLVEGEDCKNQAFRKGKAVAVQFHVETDPGEVPGLCDAYEDELAEFGKTKDEIVWQFTQHAEPIRRSGYRFLDNFFNL